MASSLSGRQAEGHLVPGGPVGAVGELREECCPRHVARFSARTLLSCRVNMKRSSPVVAVVQVFVATERELTPGPLSLPDGLRA